MTNQEILNNKRNAEKYEKLLKKYIAHIRALHGDDFLDTGALANTCLLSNQDVFDLNIVQRLNQES